MITTQEISLLQRLCRRCAVGVAMIAAIWLAPRLRLRYHLPNRKCTHIGRQIFYRRSRNTNTPNTRPVSNHCSHNTNTPNIRTAPYRHARRATRRNSDSHTPGTGSLRSKS